MSRVFNDFTLGVKPHVGVAILYQETYTFDSQSFNKQWMLD